MGTPPGQRHQPNHQVASAEKENVHCNAWSAKTLRERLRHFQLEAEALASVAIDICKSDLNATSDKHGWCDGDNIGQHGGDERVCKTDRLCSASTVDQGEYTDALTLKSDQIVCSALASDLRADPPLPRVETLSLGACDQLQHSSSFVEGAVANSDGNAKAFSVIDLVTQPLVPPVAISRNKEPYVPVIFEPVTQPFISRTTEMGASAPCVPVEAELPHVLPSPKKQSRTVAPRSRSRGAEELAQKLERRLSIIESGGPGLHGDEELGVNSALESRATSSMCSKELAQKLSKRLSVMECS